VSLAGRAKREAIMRIVSMIGITLGSLLLSSCGSTSSFIGDHLPEWAGGLPADAPPRRGEPGYQTYMQQVDGDQNAPANATSPPPPAPAAANPPPPKAPGRVNQPVR
jgi:hypothetical protein